MSVVWPTSTPFTSVMALFGPGAPSKGTPKSRARGLAWAATMGARARIRKNAVWRRCDRNLQASSEGGSIKDRKQGEGCRVWCELEADPCGTIAAMPEGGDYGLMEESSGAWRDRRGSRLLYEEKISSRGLGHWG